MCRRWMVLATIVCSISIVIATAVPAVGTPDRYDLEWSKQGTGANHQWAMAKAMEIARSRGAGWVDQIALEHSKWPDSMFGDHIDHNANWWGSYPSYFDSSWGNRFGNPQGKTQMYYDRTVAALRRGDRIEASKNLGYASHYLMDVNGPLHTQESAKETGELHGGVEHGAAATDLSAYIKDDGYQYYGGYSSPSALVVANATSSNAYYADLVSTFSAHGFNQHVKDIEGVNINRGINSLADIILSAQLDADSLNAVIDTVSPSTITTGATVTFAGHGADPMGHAIQAWNWRSTKDGQLSTSPSFSRSALSMGIHGIYFKVRCSGPKWSAETFRPIVVGAENTKPRAVYRFFNVHTGVHFYTASEQEMMTVRSTLASSYSLEGIAYALDTSSTVNTAPLYRFFDFTRGVHFLTADENEKNTIINTLGNVYRYDGVVANVSKTPTASSPVWRFYNFRKGVHFYTASQAERDVIVARLGETYRLEGIAYYYDPPW